jgi:hypothetical protein
MSSIVTSMSHTSHVSHFIENGLEADVMASEVVLANVTAINFKIAGQSTEVRMHRSVEADPTREAGWRNSTR